ncbi:MAG: sugar ABC transporter substrate-binding protein [Chloroflexi bacterium]|nr:sugar ABC transporter substrate-binding protein [Chloroflexota bacterium]
MVTRRTMMTGGLPVVGVAAGLLAACGPNQTGSGGAGAAPRPASGTLTWFMRANTQEMAWEQAAVQAFKSAQPGATVNLETVASSGEFDPKLTALFAGGTPPDVWTHWGQSGFADYHARSLLGELTSFITRDKLDTSTFMPGVYDVWKRDGKLYGLSFNQRFGTFVYYNKQLLQQAGLQPPPASWDDRTWTWDKMVEYARKQTTGGNFGIATGAQPGLWGLAYLFGGDWFTKEHYETGVSKTHKATSPEVREAMQARADLMHKLRAYPTPADGKDLGTTNHRQQFVNGRLAMFFDTGSEWPGIDTGAKFEWGVTPAPRQKDNRNINFVNPLMLAKESKNKDAAWAFIKWHVSEPGQRVLVQNAFQPVHRALLEEWIKGSKVAMPAADVRKVVEGATAKSQIGPNQIMVDFGPIRTAVDESMKPVWEGSKSAVDGLRDAAQQLDKIVSDTYARYAKK